VRVDKIATTVSKVEGRNRARNSSRSPRSRRARDQRVLRSFQITQQHTVNPDIQGRCLAGKISTPKLLLLFQRRLRHKTAMWLKQNLKKRVRWKLSTRSFFAPKPQNHQMRKVTPGVLDTNARSERHSGTGTRREIQMFDQFEK
jgi:hypothetical protein